MVQCRCRALPLKRLLEIGVNTCSQIVEEDKGVLFEDLYMNNGEKKR